MVRQVSAMVVMCFAAALFAACVRNEGGGQAETHVIDCGSHRIEVTLDRKNEQVNSLVSWDVTGSDKRKISEWKLPYPVFHFEIADVNGDGVDDILVGVVKTTRFDSVPRKRIFIFKLFEGYVRPLWLGSRVSQPLEDLRVCKVDGVNVIRTIEVEESGRYLVAEYKWRGFGLQFLRYLVRNSTLEDARRILT